VQEDELVWANPLDGFNIHPSGGPALRPIKFWSNGRGPADADITNAESGDISGEKTNPDDKENRVDEANPDDKETRGDEANPDGSDEPELGHAEGQPWECWLGRTNARTDRF
jgi:hypothetical protein